MIASGRPEVKSKILPVVNYHIFSYLQRGHISAVDRGPR